LLEMIEKELGVIAIGADTSEGRGRVMVVWVCVGGGGGGARTVRVELKDWAREEEW
jgi:hypothetical protein